MKVQIEETDRSIELYFDRKPSVAIRDIMKAQRWWWNETKRCWYNKNTTSNMEFAIALKNGEYDAGNYVSIPKDEKRISKTENKISETKPVKKVVQRRLNIGDMVRFTSKDGNEYAGKVKAVDGDKLTVRYVSEYDGFLETRETETIDEKLAKKFTTDSVEVRFLNKGDLVQYFSDNDGIRVGRVEDVITELGDFSVAWVDLKYYRSDSLGGIHYEYNALVDEERLITKLYSPYEFYPVKENDKVECVNSEGEKVVGHIYSIDYSKGTVSVEYKAMYDIGSFNRYIWDISITEITLLKRRRVALHREEVIPPEFEQDIKYNESVKQQIVDKADVFNPWTIVRPKKSLYRHQKAGCMLAERYSKFAFFYDTGTGKTAMALSIIAQKHIIEGVKFLIVAPKSIIKTAWLDDANTFFDGMRILPLYKGFDDSKKKSLLRAWISGEKRTALDGDKDFEAYLRMAASILDIEAYKYRSVYEVERELSIRAQHYIINPEMFIKKYESIIDDYSITGIIFDESAVLKNYRSKTASVLRDAAAKMKYVYLLSGKPAPNNESEFYSQMKIVAPELFKMSYESFLHQFCIQGPGGKYDIDPINRDLFAEMVSAKSLIISKEDCLDLPPTIEIIRQIELPDDVMDDYNELFEECMAVIKGMDQSATFYSTQSKVAVLMKLRQMASGFFISADGREREIISIHKEKIAELDRIIEELGEEQVIIWCQFRYEIETVAKEPSKYGRTVTAYGKTKDLERSIDDFKTGVARYIVAHPKTLKYGVTFTNCRYAVYYSFSYSAEDYDQSHDRNYRMGQTQSCTYIFLQAADTIDEIMYEKVMNKLSASEFFERLIKEAAKHGIDYDTLKPKAVDRSAGSAASQGVNSEIVDSFQKLQDRIIKKSQERAEKSGDKEDKIALSTYDYLGILGEPTYYELDNIMDEIESVRPVTSYPVLPYIPSAVFEETKSISEAYSICSDPDLSEIYDGLDMSRFSEYAVLEEDEELTTYDSKSNLEDFYVFLASVPQDDKWKYLLMYRLNKAVEKLPTEQADIAKMLYGIGGEYKHSKNEIMYLYSYLFEEDQPEYLNGLKRRSRREMFNDYVDKMAKTIGYYARIYEFKDNIKTALRYRM